MSICLLFSGCQVHSSAVTETSGVEGVAADGAIPDDVLQDHGMETLWYSPPDSNANPVALASLLPDGLFLATQSTSTRGGSLRRIHRQSGETEWSFPMEHNQALRTQPSVYRYPASAGDKRPELYFGQLDTIYVVDLQWGDLLQKHSLPFPVATSVAANEDFYFVGSDDGRAYSIRKSNQREEWTHRTRGSMDASPVLGAASVLFASTDGTLYSFVPATGWVRGTSWQFDTGAAVICDPVAYSQWVLVGSTDYKLYCLEQRSGRLVWSFLAEAPIVEAPVVYSYRPAREFVYCIGSEETMNSTKRTLFSVRLRDGQSTWRRSGVRRVVSIGKDSVYVINDPEAGEKKTLSALDAETGEEKFRLDIEQYHFVPTNLADHGRDRAERGRVFLVARNGAVQVIGEK